jgi:predicted nucleic acid-binding protein
MKKEPKIPKTNDLCVDASLWIRLLTPETLSEEADKIFSLWLDAFDFFIAPSLLVFEVNSALRKKFKKGEIKGEQVEEAMKRFSRFPILLYQSKEFFAQTWEWAQKLDETVIYDVSYLALAAWQKTPFYTCDQAFYEKAKAFYPDTHLV